MHRNVTSGRWTGVVCDDRATVLRRTSAVLDRCGIEVVGQADSFVPLLTLVLRVRPTLAVITLPLSGTSGLTSVAALRVAAPSCQVVLLSALGNLEAAAREAGACAALPEDDPLALTVVLRQLVCPPPHPLPRASEDERQQTAVTYGCVPDAATPSASSAVAAGSSTTKPAS